jgi:hypothetical protein
VSTAIPIGNEIPLVNTGAGTPRNLTGGGDWAQTEELKASNRDIQNNGISHGPGRDAFIELDDESLCSASKATESPTGRVAEPMTEISSRFSDTGKSLYWSVLRRRNVPGQNKDLGRISAIQPGSTVCKPHGLLRRLSLFHYEVSLHLLRMN